MIREHREYKRNEVDGLSPEAARAYREKLRFREPGKFYREAQAVQQDPYSERGQELWFVRDGEVRLNKQTSQEIIKARSIFADGPRQEKMGEQLLELLTLVNSVSRQTGGMLDLRRVFNFPQRVDGEYAPISFNLEETRKLLNAV